MWPVSDPPCCRWGFTDILGLLLLEKVDPNIGDYPRVPFPETTWEHGHELSRSGPPLDIAAEHGRAATVSYVLKHGAEVDIKDIRWETALHKACTTGQETVVSVLLRASWSDKDQNRASIYSIYDSPVPSSMSAAAERTKPKFWRCCFFKLPNPSICKLPGRESLRGSICQRPYNNSREVG